MKNLLISVLALALALTPVLAQSQEKPPSLPSTLEMKPPDSSPRPPARETGSRANVLILAEEDYRIGAGDALDIRVGDAEELSGIFRVRADGTIRMHFLGRFLVLDKTTEELAKFITDNLRGKYLFEPRVSIDVTELNSRAIYIQGAVNRPGVYQIESRGNLLQLLVLAGGLMQNHSATAFIIRRIKVSPDDLKMRDAALRTENQDKKEVTEGDPQTPQETQGDEKPRLQDTEWLSKQYTLLKININGLFKGRFDQNMLLEPGDIINIPLTEMFYVSGQVKAPGSFALKETTTLRQALALAQGFTATASPGKGIIFREHPETGKRLDLLVDMGAVMAGKKEDIQIYPNDVVVIPDSQFKVWTLPLIQVALSSVMTTLLFRALSY